MQLKNTRIAGFVALGTLAFVSVAAAEACGGTVSQTGDDAGASADTGTPCKPGDVGPANPSCGDCAGGLSAIVQEICVNGVFQCPPNNMACPMMPGPCDSLPKPTCNAGACLLTPTCDGTMWQCPMAPAFCFVDAGNGDGGEAGSDASRDASGD